MRAFKIASMIGTAILIQACSTGPGPQQIDNPRGESNFAKSQLAAVNKNIAAQEAQLAKLQGADSTKNTQEIRRIQTTLFSLKAQRSRLIYEEEHLMDSP